MTGKAAGHVPQESAEQPNPLNPDTLEVVPGWGHEKLEGWIPEFASEQEIRSALEKAFDYRGDITITRKDGTKIEGYLFDRRSGSTLADSLVRIYPKDSSQKISIAYSDIAALAFTGRDTAAGKTSRILRSSQSRWSKRARARTPAPTSLILTAAACPQRN